MEIKRIYSDQLEEVVLLFDAYRVFYGESSDPERARNFLKDRLGSSASVVLAAVSPTGEKCVGFTQLYPFYSSVKTQKNWLLNDLFVEEAFRRRGIGEALIRHAMDVAYRDGALRIRLETAVSNHTAQRVYERMGFRKKEPDATFFTYERKLP